MVVYLQERRGNKMVVGDNMFDPESLISGKELAEGLTYRNSVRSWKNQEHYLSAVQGDLTTEQILESAPRVPRPLYTYPRLEHWANALPPRRSYLDAFYELEEEGE
jgi:hypothetical protein